MNTAQPFIFYSAVVVGLAGVVLLITTFLGGKHRAKQRDEVYEAGLIPTGGARNRFPVRFYRYALFFLIFDLEVAFLLLWALVYRQSGWEGFIHISSFIAILGVALIYPWLQGGLDLSSKQKVLEKSL